MALGLVGTKIGMTRIFTEAGESIPVSVIEVFPNKVTQHKTSEVDGYEAMQVMYKAQKPGRTSKAIAGHCTKAGVQPGKHFKEFLPESGSDFSQFALGSEISVEIFKQGQYVDVSGVSKGKGFAGVIKRHNFSSQDATHGNSLSHNAPGSIGQRQSPGKVFKGKKMAGQLGNRNCTVQNLEVVRVDSERNLVLIRGAIPGAKGCFVVVKPAVKMPLEKIKE
jgi:large subunit ribosomal protein L3